MNSKDTLYLASNSISRKKLLKEAKLNFRVIPNNADESEIKFKDSFNRYVKEIAAHKMNKVIIPEYIDKNKRIFVLTADTLLCTQKTKTILGKPLSIEKAKEMLSIIAKEGAKAITGVNISIKEYKNAKWNTVTNKLFYVETDMIFIVKKEDFNNYFAALPEAINAAGGGIVEGYGQQFCKDVKGSFSNILGLPTYEVIKALKEMKFNF